MYLTQISKRREISAWEAAMVVEANKQTKKKSAHFFFDLLMEVDTAPSHCPTCRTGQTELCVCSSVLSHLPKVADAHLLPPTHRIIIPVLATASQPLTVHSLVDQRVYCGEAVALETGPETQFALPIGTSTRDVERGDMVLRTPTLWAPVQRIEASERACRARVSAMTEAKFIPGRLALIDEHVFERRVCGLGSWWPKGQGGRPGRGRRHTPQKGAKKSSPAAGSPWRPPTSFRNSLMRGIVEGGDLARTRPLESERPHAPLPRGVGVLSAWESFFQLNRTSDTVKEKIVTFHGSKLLTGTNLKMYNPMSLYEDEEGGGSASD
jgi:hypothetical protein